MKKELRQQLRSLPVSLRLGKQGLTIGVLKEIKAQLKKKKYLKIRFLKSYPFQKDRKTEAERLAYLVQAKVVSLLGYVLVLERLFQETTKRDLKKR